MAKKRKRPSRSSSNSSSREAAELAQLLKEAERGGSMPNMLNLPALMEMMDLVGVEDGKMSMEDMERFMGLMDTPMFGGHGANVSEDSDRRMRALMPDQTITDDQMNRQLYENVKRAMADGSRDIEKPADDYGVIANFITSFITEDMKKSFPEIASHFLRNEPMINDPSLAQAAQNRLDRDWDEKKEGQADAGGLTGQSDPGSVADENRDARPWYFRNGTFRNFLTPNDRKMDARDSYDHKILNLMVDCMRLGSEYSRNFLLALYKTYYKREYNRLKRYSTVNEYDMLTLFDESERDAKGRDATLHATGMSGTIGERLQRELAAMPGNMNCFPRADLQAHYEYRRKALKGGYVRVGRNEEGVEELVEVNRLFGSVMIEEPAMTPDSSTEGSPALTASQQPTDSTDRQPPVFRETQSQNSSEKQFTVGDPAGKNPGGRESVGEDAFGSKTEGEQTHDSADGQIPASSATPGRARLNPHALQTNRYDVTDEVHAEYVQRLDEPSIFPAVSRITVMCEVMGIRLDETCNLHIIEMNEERKKQSENYYNHVIGKEGDKTLAQLIEDLSAGGEGWIRAAYPETANPSRYQKDVSYLALQLAQDMVQQVLSGRDIFKTVIYGTREFNFPRELSHALFMLERNYPGYMPGFGHVVLLAMINYLSEVIADIYQMREQELIEFANIEPEHYIGKSQHDTYMGRSMEAARKDMADAERSLNAVIATSGLKKDEAESQKRNDPERNHSGKYESADKGAAQKAREITHSATKGTKEGRQGDKSPEYDGDVVSAADPADKDAEIARLQEIIASQQKQLKEKDEALFLREQAVIRQRTLYEEAREKADAYENSRAEYEVSRKELTALRNHIFNITEDDVEEEQDQVLLERMKRAIADKKIMIIGGHENWQKRLRKLFPKWKFVAASDNLGLDTIEGMDHIYFFTDFMSHALYYKFIGLMRRREMDWYYLHGTNIEKNVRQIYSETVRMG